ncbi:glycosyltransferase family 4 protein [Devosia sp. ZB163]|uniref:glycosyltransferase family 4 protein n=1 Tax=Devosia sp. ZB163 TaxID=3025938 RepID=UPI00235ED1DF|nr:glycosyltransferase family 4 protein [Devosia sp. ZB163]MDC9826310.1 glycosyltransferase family 4 protein [Devosia sp. ZB163]
MSLIAEGPFAPVLDVARPGSNALGDAPLAGKKVLIIVENLPVPFDRRVWLEATTLSKAGALVSVICPIAKGYTKRYELIDGIHVYRHPLPAEGNGPIGYLKEYGAALFWETLLAFKVLRKHGFDAIHACNPPDLIFLVAMLFKPFGKRFVFDHHDINPELYEAKFGRRDLFWRLMLLLERLTFALADVSIATNHSYRDIAIERGRKQPGDVFVVRSGPDLNKIKPVAPNPRWKRGREHLVGYVGVMGAQEGVDLLLEAVQDIVVRQGRTDIQFCIAGSGPELEQLRAQVRELDLQDFVDMPGRISDADLFEMLSTADVCVNPDRVNAMNDKSTMNKILEYMAFGKPIVQFEVTEGRYSAGEASLYAAPNDPADMAAKITELLADPARRARMGELGRERVEDRFSWNHQVRPLVAAYHRALSGK